MELVSLDEGKRIAQFAHHTIISIIQDGIFIRPDIHGGLRFDEQRGIFVTIRTKAASKHPEVVCSVGYAIPTRTLIETVSNAATAAAIRLRARKIPVKSLIVDVDILGRLELIVVNSPLEYVEKIELGRDGIMVEKGFSKALFLPQVPVERGWTKEEFLSECCVKARLMPDAWCTKEVRIYRFESESFRVESAGNNTKNVR